MPRSLSFVLVAGILLIAGLTGWGVVMAVQDMTKGPQEVGSNLATRVQQVIYPTPTVYPDSATVILQIQALARLETAQYTIEKVVTAETGQGALGALFGDRLLFVAHGQVIAGVDLGKLRPSDVVITPEGQVTVIIPAAEVFVATLDNDKSYVYDRETGVLTKGDPNLETAARRVAEDEILKGALEDGILAFAQNNANAFVERLLRTLKFTNVLIVVATPQPATPAP
jgi:hypothetical protein